MELEEMINVFNTWTTLNPETTESKAMEVALQTLENSVSKDKIREFIEKHKFTINSYFEDFDAIEVEALQELLEE